MSTYLITGATAGVGRAVIDELAEEDLILLGRDGQVLETLCRSLPSARPVPVDLARPEAIAGAVRQAGLPDRLDGIVHSAATICLGRLAELTPAAWTGQLAVNVTAVAELTRVLLPALRAARGTVVFVNSGAGKAVSVQGGNGAYAASKHALVAVAEALRVEEPDVRVTTVFSGRVATGMQEKVRAYEGGTYRPDDYLPPAMVARVIAGALRLPGDSTVAELRLVPRH